MQWVRGRLDSLLRRRGLGGQTVPLEPYSVPALAVVRNNIRQSMMDGWESVRSDLIFRDDLLDALDGIETYSHVIVVFYIDRVPEGERTTGRIHPRGDTSLPEQGVLATRSQRRPNPIGVTVARLLRRRKNILRVQGLDAIDGTPVLDIKPYLPPYDSVPDAKLPDWINRLRR